MTMETSKIIANCETTWIQKKFMNLDSETPLEQDDPKATTEVYFVKMTEPPLVNLASLNPDESSKNLILSLEQMLNQLDEIPEEDRPVLSLSLEHILAKAHQEIIDGLSLQKNTHSTALTTNIVLAVLICLAGLALILTGTVSITYGVPLMVGAAFATPLAAFVVSDQVTAWRSQQKVNAFVRDTQALLQKIKSSPVNHADIQKTLLDLLESILGGLESKPSLFQAYHQKIKARSYRFSQKHEGDIALKAAIEHIYYDLKTIHKPDNNHPSQ